MYIMNVSDTSSCHSQSSHGHSAIFVSILLHYRPSSNLISTNLFLMQSLWILTLLKQLLQLGFLFVREMSACR